MRLSKTELKLLKSIAEGNKTVKAISKSLNKSPSQIYRTINQLNEKQILKNLEPEQTHIILLMQLLSEYPSLIVPLSGEGINILAENTNLKKSARAKKISEAKAISLIKNNKINEKLWPKVKEFIDELKLYESTVDNRVPKGAVIYFKNNKEIVFSTKEAINAQPTAFSAYKDYGIKILTNYNYYFLPKRKLSKEEILKHSIIIAEKEKSAKDIIYLTLFYLKFKLKKIDIIERILKGEKIEGYPSLEEIKERANVYDSSLKV